MNTPCTLSIRETNPKHKQSTKTLTNTWTHTGKKRLKRRKWKSLTLPYLPLSLSQSQSLYICTHKPKNKPIVLAQFKDPRSCLITSKDQRIESNLEHKSLHTTIHLHLKATAAVVLVLFFTNSLWNLLPRNLVLSATPYRVRIISNQSTLFRLRADLLHTTTRTSFWTSGWTSSRTSSWRIS